MMRRCLIFSTSLIQSGQATFRHRYVLVFGSVVRRIAVTVQPTASGVGVNVRLELTSIAEGLARAQSGNFDAWLADMNLAPNFFVSHCSGIQRVH